MKEQRHPKVQDCCINADIIALINVYLEEWKHRDTILWAQAFRFFYATLIVMLLPNLTNYLHIQLPSYVPVKAFPLMGIIMSIVFFYISYGYALRLIAISDTYTKILDMLDKKFRRKKLDEIKNGVFFKARIAKIFPTMLFIALLLIGLTLLVY